MSEFDISIGIEPEEKEIRVSCKLKAASQYERLDAFVKAVNAARLSKGAREVDYKFLLPQLIMKGIDTELSEMPDYLVKKIKGTRKRRKGDDESVEGDSAEIEMAQAAE